MFSLFLLLLHSIVLVSSCPPGWQPGSAVQGKCYLFANQKQVWLDAENYCRKAAADGHLTSINNAFENTDIFGKAQYNCAQFWIGFQDIIHTGKFTWIDGHAVKYTNWDAGQPDNDNDIQCVSLNGQTNGKWVTEYCGNANCFVCETFQSANTTTASITTPSTTLSAATPTTATSSTTASSTIAPSTTIPSTSTPPTGPTSMTDCYDWLNIGGAQGDGIYQITIPGATNPVSVWCDMTTDGGGWTVFQRRINGDLSFYDKTWNDYKKGFNDGLDKNLWLGNEYIHILSSKDSKVELRIDIWGDRTPGSQYANIYLWQKQSSFYIDSEANYYTLNVNTAVEGNASVYGSANAGINYNIGNQFSTIDNNHDLCNGCCTQSPNDLGGWWSYGCTYSSLNGKYIPSDWGSYVGYTWYTGNYYINPARSKMMLRRAP